MSMKQKANIYQLAEETGYSVSTVSKALNNTGRISASTRKIILDKAAEMNYIADYHAKALSLKKSWLIGIIYSDNLGIGFGHPHFSVILESFKREVEQAGYEITFINRNMGNADMTYLEFSRYRKLEGVFIVNYYSLSKQVPELIESGMPIVSADAGYQGVTTITTDDYAGGRLATNYLIDLGHDERIVHIAGPQYTLAGQHRLRGFLDVVAERNVSHHKIYEADNFGFEDGYNQARRMLDEQELPTAMFVAGDWMALGAIKALAEHQIRVPEDISVIGYDDLAFLRYTSPALTTVSQNKTEIGRKAAQLLMKEIKGEPTQSTMVDVEIVVRDTCRKRK